jgi:hypothetical protein
MTNWFELQFSMNSVNLAKRSLVQNDVNTFGLHSPCSPHHIQPWSWWPYAGWW